jgi:hypothetical protein
MANTRTARGGLGIIRRKGSFGKRVKFGDPPDFVGLQVFGWWKGNPTDPSALLEAASFWKCGKVKLLAERDVVEDRDGRVHQNALYIQIDEFPPTDEMWRRAVEQTLKLFVQLGAVIAWAGGYESILLYEPTEAMAGCYAAYTAKTGYFCLSGLDEPLRFLDERPDLIRSLHEAVRTSCRGSLLRSEQSS